MCLSLPAMAALNRMSAANSMARRIDLWQPSGRARLEIAAASCVSIYSPSWSQDCRCRWDTRGLRWNLRDIDNVRNGGSGFRVCSSVLCQGESKAQFVEDSTTSSSSVELVDGPRKAAEVVQEFYNLINQRDYVGVTNLFTEDCEYEDFNFPESTKGREEILKFFKKVMSSFGTELKFVIDDITRDDPNAVGVIWHLDWRGKAFPFSRGCSFYRCEVNTAGDQQIKYARDTVEPAMKPGKASMGALKLVTSLFERFPNLADRL